MSCDYCWKMKMMRIQTVQVTRSRTFRETLPSYVFPDMLAILARLSHSMFAKLKDDKKTNDKIIFLVEITTECFRSLRNACAGCKRNQEEVLR